MKAAKTMITVYWPGSFFGSINKTEGVLVEHGTRKYAQYDNAPYVTMVPKGKRKPVMIMKEYRPYILILAGVGHPAPDDMYIDPVDHGNGIVSKKSRYSSFDERWESDFDAKIDPYIASGKAVVIADYRHTKGFNSTHRRVIDDTVYKDEKGNVLSIA